MYYREFIIINKKNHCSMKYTHFFIFAGVLLLFLNITQCGGGGRICRDGLESLGRI